MEPLHTLLTTILEAGASDVHLRVGRLPGGRIGGDSQRFGSNVLSDEQLEHFTRLMMDRPEQYADFAYSLPGLARFRVNAYYQRGSIGMIMRVIEDRPIPTFEQPACRRKPSRRWSPTSAA